MSKKVNPVTQYMNEQFMFGGELLTRQQIIAELREIGGTQQMIDRYMMGLDLSKRLAK